MQANKLAGKTCMQFNRRGEGESDKRFHTMSHVPPSRNPVRHHRHQARPRNQPSLRVKCFCLLCKNMIVPLNYKPEGSSHTKI
jgi:hypothetical protein